MINMKNLNRVFVVCLITLCSCSASKTYFNGQIRKKIEQDGVPLSKLQYYIDRDVVLQREVIQGEAKVTTGIVRFENGKKLEIITLKKNTPGVCVNNTPGKLLISFEVGEGKSITFGKTKVAGQMEPYKILINDWIGSNGVITYEGKQYMVKDGYDAAIMIKTSELNKYEVNKRQVKGRSVTP